MAKIVKELSSGLIALESLVYITREFNDKTMSPYLWMSWAKTTVAATVML